MIGFTDEFKPENKCCDKNVGKLHWRSHASNVSRETEGRKEASLQTRKLLLQLNFYI